MKLLEISYWMHPQLTAIWSQFHSRWSPQLTDISKHKDGYSSVIFTDSALQIGVEVAHECDISQ